MAELLYKFYRILIDFEGKTEENISCIKLAEQTGIAAVSAKTWHRIRFVLLKKDRWK